MQELGKEEKLWDIGSTHLFDDHTERCDHAVVDDDELGDGNEAKDADDVDGTDHIAQKERANDQKGHDDAGGQKQRTRSEDKDGQGGQSTAIEHVGEDLAEAVEGEAAPQAEVGKTKDDGGEREPRGAGKLAKINRIVWRSRFGFVHGRGWGHPTGY